MPEIIIPLFIIILLSLIILSRRSKLATLQAYAHTHQWQISSDTSVLEPLEHFLPGRQAKPFFTCTKYLHNLPSSLIIYHFRHKRANKRIETWGSLLAIQLPSPAPTFQLIGPWAAWPIDILHRSNLTSTPLLKFSHGKCQLSIADEHDLEVSQLFSDSLIKKIADLPYGLVIETQDRQLFLSSDRFFMTTKELDQLQKIADIFLEELLPKLAILSKNVETINTMRKV